MGYKSTPAHIVHELIASNVSSYPWGTYPSYSYRDFAIGSNTIEYGDGRKSNGKWPWKPCVHRQMSGWDRPTFGEYSRSIHAADDPSYHHSSMAKAYILGQPQLPPAPPSSFDNDVYGGILDQLDLNKGESVLLYSGVLQAVPLVGAAFKLSSILNKAARNLSKSFRKKPFTTVVKSLISLDFVDRFVISPTIDDARKFMNATNYVLNVIQSARERSAHQFALDSTSKQVVMHKETSFSDLGTSYNTFSGTCTMDSYNESKAYALLEAKYDLDASTPLRLWARRTGLTRPLDSVWDLVPFSFVIDYFTRAGDFISALSDEMSDDLGLRGRITRIIGLWATHKVVRQTSFSTTSSTYFNPGSTWIVDNEQFLKGTATWRDNTFTRYQVPDPWRKLMQLQETISDYLTIDLDISSTQKRTLAELFIQAKL